MRSLDHERLDAYQAAVDFVALAQRIVGEMPSGGGHLGDQLRRAALSIPLNIAEGAGDFASGEKKRFYRIARRSATECGAILDVAERLGHFEEEALEESRRLIHRIVSMLTRMVNSLPGARVARS